MREIKSPEESTSKDERFRLASLSKAELELLVIEAIREHRRLVESDQIIYEEWERVKADPGVPFEQVERLEAECLRRLRNTAAQQDALADLLDALGYTPKVPEDSS